MKDDFEHRSVDGATAPRPTGLGPNSPFAMAALYLGHAAAPQLAPAPIPVSAPAPAARSALPTQCQLLPTGALRLVIDGAEVFMSPAGTRDFAVWLTSTLIARAAAGDACVGPPFSPWSSQACQPFGLYPGVFGRRGFFFSRC